MNIGLTRYKTTEREDSLKYVFRVFEEALEPDHRLIYYRGGTQKYTPERRLAEATVFVEQCDIIVNCDVPEVYEARSRSAVKPPCFHYLLGDMARGGLNISKVARYITTNDLLVGNCASDLGIARQFFSNANLKCLPFAFEDENFFPLDERETKTVREEFGYTDRDFLILYPGRITLEKNVHSLISLFAEVLKHVPHAHLLLAGSAHNFPFVEFGVWAIDFEEKLHKLVKHLEIPAGRVRFLGHCNARSMLHLFNAADVAANLTLHHDENFGFAQVEAMACGTPVIGTQWGGLKDTIIDGVTGFQIKTALTAQGVKIDWWDAVNKLVLLGKDRGLCRRFSAACVAHTADRYHKVVFKRALNTMVEEMRQSSAAPAEPLRPTRFGMEFWLRCGIDLKGVPPYRRGPAASRLYQSLIAPFTGTPDGVMIRDTVDRDTILILASPITVDSGAVRIEDPIYPQIAAVPPLLLETVEMVLVLFQSAPVQRVRQILESGDRSDVEAALVWLLNSGILLPSRPIPEAVCPETVGAGMSRPLFNIRYVDAPCDIVAIR